MSYSMDTGGCVPVHAHYSNQPKFVRLQGQPRFQMLSKLIEIHPFIFYLCLAVCDVFFRTIRLLGWM